MIAITERLFQPNISKYFIDNYNLQPSDVIALVRNFYNCRQNQLQKGRERYHNLKHNDDYHNKIKQHCTAWYQKNKVRVSALQRSKYQNDPIFREYYQKYQALYQRQDYEPRGRGRPRIY